MPTRIGKSARQYLEERRSRDAEFGEALAEVRLEGELASEIARLRDVRGMSQYDLAEASGIKQPMINRIERGAQNPTLPTLTKLARALDATIQISAAGVEIRPASSSTVAPPEITRRSVALPISYHYAHTAQLRYIERVGVRRVAHTLIPTQVEGNMLNDLLAASVSRRATNFTLDDNLIGVVISGASPKSRDVIRNPVDRLRERPALNEQDHISKAQRCKRIPYNTSNIHPASGIVMERSMKLISSRRAFEFQMDDLRLTILSLPVVQEEVRKLFGFAGVEVGSPVPTFGPVPPTLPPGIVFYTGAWISPEQQLFPIRMINVEPRRIVIDVAGPSSAIEPIFSLLRQSLQSLAAPDGSPAIGEPERIRDFSEISVDLPFDPISLIMPSAREVLSRATIASNADQKLVIVPIITLQVQDANDEFPGIEPMAGTSLQLALRAGTRPGEHTYYSAAPLTSDAHQAYLTELQGLPELSNGSLDTVPKVTQRSTKRNSSRRQASE